MPAWLNRAVDSNRLLGYRELLREKLMQLSMQQGHPGLLNLDTVVSMLMSREMIVKVLSDR
jgi:hypothetical protein